MISPEYYDSDYFQQNGQDRDRAALRLYARLLRRYTQGPYVDWGCGSGFLLRRLAKFGDSVGLDPSEHARRRSQDVCPASICVEDSSEIPSGFAGGIAAIHVLEHITDQEVVSTLAEWRRILQPEGIVLVATPDLTGKGHELTGDRWLGFTDPTHVNLKGALNWARVLSASGFTPIVEGSDGLWNGPYRTSLKAEAIFRRIPSALAVASGRLVSRVGHGESYVAVWRLSEAHSSTDSASAHNG